jgi:hypothetical protein
MLRLWDAEKGELNGTLIGHSGSIESSSYSTDGGWILSMSWDGIRVWDGRTGNAVLYFPHEHFSCAVLGQRGCVAAGDDSGRYVLNLVGLGFEPPLVTAVYIYRFDLKHYDDKPSAKCALCGRRFPAPPVIIDTILAIAKTSQFSHRLPDEAWQDPRLLSECPHCYQPVRFNPFIVDSRDWL